MEQCPIRVLLIEDDPDDELLAREALSEASRVSFRVTHANSLAGGLALLNEHAIDVVLLDLGLPDSQGLDTLTQARAHAGDLPIVVLSGVDDDRIGMEAVRCGAQDYMSKAHLEPVLLSRTLCYAIERQRLGLALRDSRAELQAYSERLEERVAERTHALEEAQAQLIRQTKLAVLGQLAGSIAHELRTPLSAIKNVAYLLNLLLPESNRAVRENLDILNHEVRRQEEIIAGLLNFARTQQSVKIQIDLNQTLLQVLDGLEAPPTVEMERDLAHLPTVRADPGQLGRIVENLVRNAIQAMPDGGRLTIKSWQPRDGWVAVSIADTGVGIPPENLPHLFEPLFTTKAKGIGLGLALAKTLSDAHGGQIAVESEVGQGATFTLQLPLSTESEPSAAAA